MRVGLALVVAAACLCAFTVTSPARAESRVALVIGNGAYASAPLANPKRDAALMARTLRSVGFEVQLLTDADQATMRRAVIEFGRRLKGEDTVGLFYYAGHGVQADGENYLVPVGADIQSLEEVALNGLDLSELLKTMSRAESRLNIVILDACRDNPFAAATRSGLRGLAQVSAPSGTLIAYATAPGDAALDGTGENSPYTSALAAHVPLEGVPVEEVFRRTRRAVLAATAKRQTPWEHSSLTGEFFFKPKHAAPEVSQRDTGEPPDQGTGLAEIAAWNKIKASNDPAAFRRHLESFPGGIFSELATVKLVRLASAGPGESAIKTGAVEPGDAPREASAEDLYEEALKLDADGAETADLARAAVLYRRSAERGLPAAMHAYGRTLDKGRGVAQDYAEAARWYRSAADLDYAPAMAALGTMHEFGEGVPRDLAEALRLYRLAADKGDAHAMTSLAYLYAEGKGVAASGAEAQRWYTAAAEAGNVRAMYNLALLLSRGGSRGGELAEAVRWLEAASARGHTGAMRELACLYDEGRGVARSSDRAAEYLIASFKARDQRAEADLLRRPDTWSFATRREIQRQLKRQGLYTGLVTGLFGPETHKALEQLASQH